MGKCTNARMHSALVRWCIMTFLRSEAQQRQARALSRNKGPRRDLSIKRCIPPPGHDGGACGASSVRRQPVLADQVAVSGDEQVAARCAAGVFERADLARQIPRIDVPEAMGPADL